MGAEAGQNARKVGLVLLRLLPGPQRTPVPRRDWQRAWMVRGGPSFALLASIEIGPSFL